MNKDIIVWEKVNVRPSDYNRHDYNCGDCTTRALTYALNPLGDSRSYKEIEDEQYRLAKEMNHKMSLQSNYRQTYNYHRNSSGVWDKLILAKGYTWLHLNRKKSNGYLIKWFGNINKPILMLSNHHVCVAHNGKLIDTWNSCGIRIENVCVPNELVNTISTILEINGIMVEKVCKPVLTISPRKSRYYC